MGREARVVIKATDVTLSKFPVQNLSVRTTLAGTVAGIETDGPLAGVSVDLEGHGHLFALATRKAVDELELHPGARGYALVKAVALLMGAPSPRRKIGKPSRPLSSVANKHLTEMRARPDRSLGPVLQSELPQNGFHMHLHRRLGDHQLARDDLVRGTLPRQDEQEERFPWGHQVFNWDGLRAAGLEPNGQLMFY